MHRSLSLRYLLFTTLLFPIIRVFSPRAESATFFVRHGAIFCYLAKLLQKIIDSQKNQHIASYVATRPRNPRFKDVHTGTKRRLVDKKSNLDSGISGSGCYYLCNHLAKLLQKIMASQKKPTTTRPHFWNESPFQTFRKNCQPRIKVEILD